MSFDADFLLACVHLYSALGERRKSRYFDKLFVHMMKRSMDGRRLDSRGPME